MNISVISIITSRFDEMLQFYRDVMGFKIKMQLENFVEFENNGVRFEMSTHKVLNEATNHESFLEDKKGQSFELAFSVPLEDMNKVYEEITSKGATPIKEPEDMPWGQRTAFFADPDGNIHEIFADLKKE